MIEVDCEHCHKLFEVADSLAGGITNCPGCGKATPVAGLRDPWYRLTVAGMAVAWAVLTAVGWASGGWLGALILGGGCALLFLLLHIAL